MKRTKEKVGKSKKLYKRGKTLEEIADIIGVHYTTVSRWVGDIVESDNGGRDPKLVNNLENEIDELVEMYNDGLSLRKISEKYSVSRDTIRRLFDKHDVEIRKKFVDEAGNNYGHLFVIERAGFLSSGPLKWKCRCDCGEIIEVASHNLRSGKRTSCGKGECKYSMKRVKDLSGNIYGELEIIEYMGSIDGDSTWKCECSCGDKVVKKAKHLKSGNTKSCGHLMTNENAGEDRMYRNYQRNAERKGLKFKLSKKVFYDFIKGKCFYCGREPEKRIFNAATVNSDYFANGIDRKNPDKGYIESNCVSCCFSCNYMKGDKEMDEFLEKCKQIAKHKEVVDE